MLCFMETQIKTQYGLIKYERATKFTLEEGSFLSKAIKEAFLLLNSSAQKLKKGEVDEGLTATLFKDASGLSATLDGLIASFKDKSLKCMRESVYEGNEGGAEASVLSSVSEDSGEIKIYDAFFDTKQIGDDRAGVIIHEAAHLAGLRGEGNADSAGLESAEAVKNFCLCANGRLSLEEIAAEAEAPENPDSDELTYNPDQARAPKGQSNGGQWVAEGDNGGAAKGGESKSAQKSASAAAENASPAEEEEEEEEAQSKDANSQSEKNEAKGETNSEAKEAEAPKGAISKDLRMEKIDENRNPTGKYVDFSGTFNTKPYVNPKTKERKEGVWSAFDFYDKGYEKNSDNTIIVHVEIKYKNPKNGYDTKAIDVAYDVKANEKGEVKIPRLSVVNIDWKSEEMKKINDYITIYGEGNFNISMRISTVKGRPKDVFGAENIEQGKISDSDITHYAQVHASASKEINYAPREGAEGGVIKNYSEKPGERKIYDGSVNINIFNGEVKDL